MGVVRVGPGFPENELAEFSGVHGGQPPRVARYASHRPSALPTPYLFTIHSYFSIIVAPRSSATTPVRHISIMPIGFMTSMKASIFDDSPVTSIHMVEVL